MNAIKTVNDNILFRINKVKKNKNIIINRPLSLIQISKSFKRNNFKHKHSKTLLLYIS